jgi:hypothetical protein
MGRQFVDLALPVKSRFRSLLPLPAMRFSNGDLGVQKKFEQKARAGSGASAKFTTPQAWNAKLGEEMAQFCVMW